MDIIMSRKNRDSKRKRRKEAAAQVEHFRPPTKSVLFRVNRPLWPVKVVSIAV